MNNYLAPLPAGCLALRDDGTGKYCYYTAAPNGGYLAYGKASMKAKVKPLGHATTEAEADRKLERYMENF